MKFRKRRSITYTHSVRVAENLSSANAGKQKLRAASFSIGVNAFLIGLKATVAVITGSLAILAELVHSLFDIVASVLAYVGIKQADKPADKDHLYGHDKFEYISSLVQTILIVMTSLLIIYESVNRLVFTPSEAPKQTELGLMIMVVTIGVDYFVSRYLDKVSRKHGSAALEADAAHFSTDLLGALAVIIGLGFVVAGFPIFDAIAAIAVAILMLWISYKLGRKAMNILTDACPSQEILERIAVNITSTPGVIRFHKLKARHVGNKLLVEFHIHVSNKMSVEKAHLLAHNIKKKLMIAVPSIIDMTIHIEPSDKYF